MSASKTEDPVQSLEPTQWEIRTSSPKVSSDFPTCIVTHSFPAPPPRSHSPHGSTATCLNPRPVWVLETQALTAPTLRLPFSVESIAIPTLQSMLEDRITLTCPLAFIPEPGTRQLSTYQLMFDPFNLPKADRLHLEFRIANQAQ